jgi:hypothetical protein
MAHTDKHVLLFYVSEKSYFRESYVVPEGYYIKFLHIKVSHFIRSGDGWVIITD